MTTDDERVKQRAGELLPEESSAGVDDAEALAAAVLEDSDARQADGDAAPAKFVEHRPSSAD